jgi:hypothetical protein
VRRQIRVAVGARGPVGAQRVHLAPQVIGDAEGFGGGHALSASEPEGPLGFFDQRPIALDEAAKMIRPRHRLPSVGSGRGWVRTSDFHRVRLSIRVATRYQPLRIQ